MSEKIRVTVSYAQSLDGQVATSSGESRWISGPDSLEYAHALRRDNEAILVGIGTVLRDDPLLTCRLPGARSPHRLVLDSQLRLPATCRLARTAAEIPTTVFTTHQRLQQNDAQLRRLTQAGVAFSPVTRAPSGGLNLIEVLERLSSFGLRSLFVEGGARVITAFVAAELVDELHLVIAPILIGAGLPAIGDIGTGVPGDAPRFRTIEQRMLGEDLLWRMKR